MTATSPEVNSPVVGVIPKDLTTQLVQSSVKWASHTVSTIRNLYSTSQGIAGFLGGCFVLINVKANASTHYLLSKALQIDKTTFLYFFSIATALMASLRAGYLIAKDASIAPLISAEGAYLLAVPAISYLIFKVVCFPNTSSDDPIQQFSALNKLIEQGLGKAQELKEIVLPAPKPTPPPKEPLPERQPPIRQPYSSSVARQIPTPKNAALPPKKITSEPEPKTEPKKTWNVTKKTTTPPLNQPETSTVTSLLDLRKNLKTVGMPDKKTTPESDSTKPVIGLAALKKATIETPKPPPERKKTYSVTVTTTPPINNCTFTTTDTTTIYSEEEVTPKKKPKDLDGMLKSIRGATADSDGDTTEPETTDDEKRESL